jgi:hypothetical protein
MSVQRAVARAKEWEKQGRKRPRPDKWERGSDAFRKALNAERDSRMNSSDRSFVTSTLSTSQRAALVSGLNLATVLALFSDDNESSASESGSEQSESGRKEKKLKKQTHAQHIIGDKQEKRDLKDKKRTKQKKRKKHKKHEKHKKGK